MNILGILNVTPDSFSDGGEFINPEAALKHASQLIQDGADFIDVGAQSTRPGAEILSAEVELQRLAPLFPDLARYPLSIDTFYPEVAKFALEHGAKIINCVKPSMFPEMLPLAKKFDAKIVLLYDIVGLNVIEFFKLHQQYKSILIYDLGFGFHKSYADNLDLLRNIAIFTNHFNFRPMMIGVSRKSFVQKLTDLPAKDTDYASAVLAAWANLFGVDYIRTHNPKYNRQWSEAT